MPSVTADTNIYVSALQFGGIPRRFLEGADVGAFRLDISEAILRETLRVLRTKFHWAVEELRNAERDIRSYTQVALPAETLTIIQTDPSDNRILECAVAANSDYIVTGDARHILPLGSFAGFPSSEWQRSYGSLKRPPNRSARRGSSLLPSTASSGWPPGLRS